MIWQLVMEGMATLAELETTWSLDDVLRAAALLEAKADIAADLTPKGK